MSEIRHLHNNNMSASVVNTVDDFAFINFKIFPNPSVIPSNSLAGGTININCRCCLLTHTFFNFLFTPLIMLICASEPVCGVKHALKNTQNDCHQWLSDSSRVHQIRFRPGRPTGGAHDAPPDPLVGWGGGYPIPIPHLLDAYGVSVSSIVDPPSSRNSPPRLGCLAVYVPIKFPTRRIFPNFHILKINRMMSFCNLAYL